MGHLRPTKTPNRFIANLTTSTAIALLFQKPLPDPALPIDRETRAESVLSGTTDANCGDNDLQKFFNGWLIGQMLGIGVPSENALSYLTHGKLVFLLHTIPTTIQTKVDNSRSL